MRKFILALRFDYLLLPSRSQNCGWPPIKSLLSLITSQNRAYSSTPELDTKSSVFVNYLIDSLKFPKDRALAVSSRFSYIKSLENPEKVVLFFKTIGLSDVQIQSIAHRAPSTLFANVEKTLKPKVVFFQGLVLSRPRVCAIIFKVPTILSRSLDRTLKPSIGLIMEVLKSDGRNRSNEKVSDDLFRILNRCPGIVSMKTRLEFNIRYLESCGVVGSQLSCLLVVRARIFLKQKGKLSQLVSTALNMNFTMGSRMLAHGIHFFSASSIEALNGKFELFGMFGFSKDELALMFRKSPQTFKLSKAMLRRKLNFFLNDLKVNRFVLVRHPMLLSYSMEVRVIPRCKVLQMLKSRRLLSMNSSLSSAIFFPNMKFVEKYILRFTNDAEELLLAYKSQLLNAHEKRSC